MRESGTTRPIAAPIPYVPTMAVKVDQGGNGVKAVLFDFMGTCLDWHSSIVPVLPHDMSEQDRSGFALEWRQAYLDLSAGRGRDGLPPQDVDVTYRQALKDTLERHPDVKSLFTEELQVKTVTQWHYEPAWPDVPAALKELRQRGYEIFVHANSTTRLQLDLCRSSGLEFDMLFSSELLGVYKPARGSFEKVLKLIRRKPEECVMVAAHAWDTAGARAVGMKTVYIRRWTDDIREDMAVVRTQNDAFLEDMSELADVVSRL